jgi:hypothetical protein
MKILTAILLLLSFSAHADRLSTIRIVGTDNVCTSYAVSATGGANVLTCVPASGPPAGAPTGCTATVNGGSNLTLTSAGGTAALSVSGCTPSSGLSYIWTKNGLSNASVLASWTDTLPHNLSTTTDNTYLYQVRVCLANACATVPPSSNLTVVVPKTGGGGWDGSTCAGFTNTVVIDIDWAAPVRKYTGAFGPNDIAVVRFTTGNVDSANNNLPRIQAAEWTSPPSGRYAVLSATPCDLTRQTWLGATSASNSPSVPFAVGSGANFGYYPILNKNTTYYFNMKNLDNQTCTAGGVCDAFVELLKPGGL